MKGKQEAFGGKVGNIMNLKERQKVLEDASASGQEMPKAKKHNL